MPWIFNDREVVSDCGHRASQGKAIVLEILPPTGRAQPTLISSNLIPKLPPIIKSCFNLFRRDRDWTLAQEYLIAAVEYDHVRKDIEAVCRTDIACAGVPLA